MMRFHCPHCQQVLEVDQPAETFLCPACELWCRVSDSEEFEPKREEIFEIAPPPEQRPYEPNLAPAEPISPVRSDAISQRPSEESTFRLRDESDEVEDVEFEILEDGTERQPKRRRPRRQRCQGGFNLDYWISPALILLFLLVPPGLFLIVLAFFLKPGAGFGALFMVGGGIWLSFIAAEDSLHTALLVAFVPFYSWHFAFANFDRVVVPFVVHVLGAIIFAISLTVMALPSGDDSSALPTTGNRVIFCPAPRVAEAIFRPI